MNVGIGVGKVYGAKIFRGEFQAARIFGDILFTLHSTLYNIYPASKRTTLGEDELPCDYTSWQEQRPSADLAPFSCINGGQAKTRTQAD